MKPYLKKFHQEYNSSDIKPKGKISRWLNKSERQKAKKEINKTEEEYIDADSLSDEIMAIQSLI